MEVRFESTTHQLEDLLAMAKARAKVRTGKTCRRLITWARLLERPQGNNHCTTHSRPEDLNLISRYRRALSQPFTFFDYLRDVLERLPAHPASRIEELLPHRWKSPRLTA